MKLTSAVKILNFVTGFILHKKCHVFDIYHLLTVFLQFLFSIDTSLVTLHSGTQTTQQTTIQQVIFIKIHIQLKKRRFNEIGKIGSKIGFKNIKIGSKNSLIKSFFCTFRTLCIFE